MYHGPLMVVLGSRIVCLGWCYAMYKSKTDPHTHQNRHPPAWGNKIEILPAYYFLWEGTPGWKQRAMIDVAWQLTSSLTAERGRRRGGEERRGGSREIWNMKWKWKIDQTTQSHIPKKRWLSVPGRVPIQYFTYTSAILHPLTQIYHQYTI